ncbi:MAG: hypothetical protein K5695_07285 [Oscillospiraceae bacterium]|nr:hypothetical protein [Oscillospiraceae bacterium]
MEPNKQKQAAYAERKNQLKKAMNSGFCFEAIFLEYAIMEDRTESVLRHEGSIPLVNKNGNPLTLAQKINRIRSSKPFTEPKIRKRLTLELLDAMDAWRVKRNKLVHVLMKNQSDAPELRLIAEEGRELVRQLDNAVKNVNKQFDARNAE